MRNSIVNNGIVDITENFEIMGQSVNIPQYVTFAGEIPQKNGKITLPSGLTLPYIYYSYLNPQYINWEDGKTEGLTIVLLSNQQVDMNDQLLKTEFIFFDVVSTYKVATLNYNGNSLQVCSGDYNLLQKSRSSIKTNLVGCDNQIQMQLPPALFLQNLSTNQDKPYGVTICIDNSLPILFPSCGEGLQKCYSNKKVVQGWCYDPSNNSQYSTYTIPQYDNSLKPTMVKNGINYWFREGGKQGCDNAPDVQQQVNDDSVNNMTGNGVLNLVEGTKKMQTNSDNLRNKVINLQAQIKKQKIDLDTRMMSLDENANQIHKNREIINSKQQILESRNRQLQLSIDKTIYYKKVVYTLLAVAIAVLVIFLLGASMALKMKSQ